MNRNTDKYNAVKRLGMPVPKNPVPKNPFPKNPVPNNSVPKNPISKNNAVQNNNIGQKSKSVPKYKNAPKVSIAMNRLRKQGKCSSTANINLGAGILAHFFNRKHTDEHEGGTIANIVDLHKRKSAPTLRATTKEVGQLNIVTWNISGLLGSLLDGDVVAFLKKFDIICLQETFLLYEFNVSFKFPNYKAIQHVASKLSKAGRPSGGIILLYKKEYEKHIKAIETENKNIIGINMNKTLLNMDKDLLLFTLYAHPAHSPYYSQTKSENTLDQLSDVIGDCLENQDKEVLILGDVNARIASWTPCIAQPEESPEENDKEKWVIYDRASKDEIVNNFGKKLIEICCCFELIPLLGLKVKHFPDDFTYVSNRGQSIVDHILCSFNMLDICCGVRIITRVESDHLPVTCRLGGIKRTEKNM